MSIIFIFLDGLGLAPASPTNPLAISPMPSVQQLLGGPLTLEQTQEQPGLLLRPLDATLGVAGLPQSGTGHVALLAGVNAPLLVGRHQPNYPPTALRPLLAEQSIFRRLVARGQPVAFANAFTSGYWTALANRRLRRPASVIAAEGAGLHLRGLDELRAGTGLVWDITGEALHRRGEGLDIPVITPAEAGQRLAHLATTHALVFFECFLPDLTGHGRLTINVDETLARIDGLIGETLRAMRPTDSLLITSDHGNLEDSSSGSHTLNPVPLLLVGHAAATFAHLTNISQIADPIFQTLT